MTYYILIFCIAFISLGIIYITSNGKPFQSTLAIEGFLDSFEFTDFNAQGRVKYDYKPWIKDKSILLVTGKILFKSYFFNWGSSIPLPLKIKIINEDIPVGMDIEIKQKNKVEAYVPGYTMTLHHICKKDSSFQFHLVLKQVDNNLVFEDPTLVKFGIEIYYDVTRLFFFNASQRKKIHYQFFVGPDLGETWVAFDPGTTGSCIAAGSPFTEVIVEKERNAEKVMPSVLTFNKTRKPENLVQGGKVNKDLYLYGSEALAQMTLSQNVAFQSIKKLLGFTNKKEIHYANGKLLELNGVLLSSLLVEGLYREFKTFIEVKSKESKSLLLKDNEFTPKRAVVAIPNNFTAPKIMDMLSCVQYLDQFKEIRYITEAESVLCYYISQHSKLHPSLEKGLKDETVLIFDMGGATINTTIADVTIVKQKNGSVYDIDIDSKIGYGIGGDTIDYCLAKSIYDYELNYPSLVKNNPFPKEEKNKMPEVVQRKLFQDIQLAMFELKKLIIKRFYYEPLVMKNKNAPSSQTKLNDYEKLFNKEEYRILVTRQELSEILNEIPGVKINVKEDSKLFQLFKENPSGLFPIFETVYFQKYVYKPIREALSDVVSLSYKEGGYIDTVILSGRSCLFPLIKETVKGLTGKIKKAGDSEKNITPVFISLGDEELKTAVVKGACWYGVHNNTVKLSPLRVDSTFGVKRKKSANPKDIDFYNLISIGKEYVDSSEGSVNGSKSINDEFRFDVGYVNFYQIMGKDALRVLQNDEKHKFSRISSIKIDTKTTKIGATVYSSDKISCKVWTVGEFLHEQNEVLDQEVADDNEEHYTWIVN